MKHSHLRADTKNNTYLLILKKAAKFPKNGKVGKKIISVPIESVTASAKLSEEAFRSLRSRGDVKKIIKRLPGKTEPEWSEHLTVKDLLHQLWPPASTKKGAKKK